MSCQKARALGEIVVWMNYSRNSLQKALLGLVDLAKTKEKCLTVR